MSLPTPPREPDSVPVLNSTPLPAFPQFWQLRPPEDALILTVKGTFDMKPGGHATPAEEQELPLGPVPFDGSEEALRYPGDMAFFKPRCDVLVAGHAYASVRAPSPVQRIELDLGRQLAFVIAAIGDRRWIRGAPSQPAAFEKIELRPERAFGGPGDPQNPVGVGRLAEDGSPLPNFELPDQLLRSTKDRPPPAMMTPMNERWGERTRHVGTYGGDWGKKRAPYFPDDFSFDYFQAAPAPLQIPYPTGDEWYRLIGMRPNDEVLEGQLPGLRMRAFAQPKDHPGELVAFPLNLDTIFFEPELLRLQLVWRGAIRVVDNYGSDLASLLVIAEPLSKPCPPEEIRRRFLAAYREAYVREPEEEDPEDEVEEAPPEGVAPPVGLDALRARALGLPAWAATLPSPPLPPAEPPRPEPALAADALAALLASGASLVGRDLSHCDLRGQDLAGRDLSHADLSFARLEGARLARAQLAGTVLTEANLAGCDLSGADLIRAVAERANLEGAKLDQARLAEATLSGSQAMGASFAGALIDGAIVHEADWSRAKLDGASLKAADLTGTRLEDATMIGAAMAEVRLYDVIAPRLLADDAVMPGCRLDGGVFAGGSFARVQAPKSSMRRCDFSDCNLQGAVLEGSVLEDCVLDRANVNQVEAKDCRWHRARATEATFVKSNLMEGVFEGVRFVECDLRGANLYDTDTFRASFDRCRLEHAILGVSGLE